MPVGFCLAGLEVLVSGGLGMWGDGEISAVLVAVTWEKPGMLQSGVIPIRLRLWIPQR